MDAAVAAPECGPRGASATADLRTGIASRAAFGRTSVGGPGVAEIGGAREECCQNCGHTNFRPHLMPPEFEARQLSERAELLVH